MNVILLYFLGYGHIVPATPVGKLATIFYAIFGIPLFLLYLSNIGDIMAKSFKFIYSRICKCQRDHKPPEQIPSGILKKPDSYRVQMLPQHVHGLSQTGIAGGPEESTSSMASGMIGKICKTQNFCLQSQAFIFKTVLNSPLLYLTLLVG